MQVLRVWVRWAWQFWHQTRRLLMLNEIGKVEATVGTLYIDKASCSVTSCEHSWPTPDCAQSVHTCWVIGLLPGFDKPGSVRVRIEGNHWHAALKSGPQHATLQICALSTADNWQFSFPRTPWRNRGSLKGTLVKWPLDLGPAPNPLRMRGFRTISFYHGFWSKPQWVTSSASPAAGPKGTRLTAPAFRGRIG